MWVNKILIKISQSLQQYNHLMRYPSIVRHYLEKSAALAETFGAQHAEEVSLRANYQSKLKKHFLSKMFPGMEDTPPAFATSPPRYGHW